MLHHTRTFEEKRKRSKSAGPAGRFRKTDIFFSGEQQTATDGISEYNKAFVWPKNALDSVDEESLKKRLNPREVTHAAGLTSRKCAANNKAHVIENSNGSRSIVIANEPIDYALTTGSATNLASLTQDASIRPLTSMALLNSELNKSQSSNGSAQTVNKSVTLANLNDYTNDSLTNGLDKQTKHNEQTVKKSKKIKNGSVVHQNGRLNEELLLEKLSKLNSYESIYGKKAGATTLFHKEEIVDPKILNKMPKKSEYKSKFKPFSTYVYVTGKGWFKPKKIKAKEQVEAKQIEEISTPVSAKQQLQDTSSVKSQDLNAASVNVAAVSKATEDEKQTAGSVKDTTDEIDALVEEKGQPWYAEALERKLKANEFRYRSEYGNPILGRLGLEEIYKKASGNSWHASNDPKFYQLQQMRYSTGSAFLPFEQHKKKLQEDKTDSKSKPKATPLKTPSKSPTSTKRAKSVPPSKKLPTNSIKSTTTKPTQQAPAKVWIKPKTKETTNEETNVKKVQKPQQNNLDKELKLAQKKNEPKSVNGGRTSPPIIQSGPVRTTEIKTPEDLLAGIKSPPPQNFIDKLDNEPINWTTTTNPSSLNSNATYSNSLMNEFNPTSLHSDNLADLSGLKI